MKLAVHLKTTKSRSGWLVYQDDGELAGFVNETEIGADPGALVLTSLEVTPREWRLSQVRAAQQLHRAGATTTDIMSRVQISRATAYRYLEERQVS